MLKTNYLVIGSGISGMMAAINLAESQKEQIILITKDKLLESNSYYAQGGIASVDPKIKSLKSHIDDTISCGCELSDKDVVKDCVNHFNKEVILPLIKYGVKFSKKDSKGNFELHQEGGHSEQRIYCVEDHTGKSVMEALLKKLKTFSNITILEHHIAINLITQNYILKSSFGQNRCLGAYVLNKIERKVIAIKSKYTFLATGGAGKIFKFTTNPNVATGDGLAMAFRAGATLSNMEFYQFHPTVLFEPNTKLSKKKFLITEALRGENVGGILTVSKNSEVDFVLKYDKRGSHATRDIVSQAIDSEIKERGLNNIYLNLTNKITKKDDNFLPKNYPTIWKKCLDYGIDIRYEAIPVISAAHYLCGGIQINNSAETEIKNLYAIGEVTNSGLMGANRLASNSLPEAAYFARVATRDAISKIDDYIEPKIKIPIWDSSYVSDKLDHSTMNQFWDSLRSIMTNLCGLERNSQRLELAKHITSALSNAADRIYKNFFPEKEVIELRNLTLVAFLVTKSAYKRRESRGVHFRSDYPIPNKTLSIPSLIKRK